MSVTMAWGGSYTVLMEVGYLTRFFTLANYGTPVTRSNLVLNPNLENGSIVPWAAAQTSCVASQDFAYVGSWSTKTTMSSTTDSNFLASSVTFTSTGNHIVSGYFYVPSGSTIAGRTVTWSFEGGTATVGSATAVSGTLAAGVWVRASTVVNVTAVGNTNIVARLSGTLSTAVGQIVYGDAFMLETGSTLNGYFDGSFNDPYAGYGRVSLAWNGTTNASTSTSSWNVGASRANLVTNPSFEVNTTGWSAYGALLSRVTGSFGSGSYVGQVDYNNTLGGGAFFNFKPTGGQNYTVSATVLRTSGTRTYYIGIEWYNGATFISQTNSAAQSCATATRLSASVTAPATATNAYIIIYSNTASVVGDAYKVDKVMLETGSSLLPYFDGEYADPYAGYELQSSRWDSTVNNSISRAEWFATGSLTGSQLDGVDVLDGTLEGIDVTQYVESIDISRGRSDQLQDFSAGTCSLVLNNNDRRFDPVNTASPYVNPSTGKSGVTPRRKVTVKHGTTSLFTGRITDIDLEYMPNPSTQSKVKVDASDDFILLASTKIATFTPPSELSGARVSRILDLAEVNFPATARSISAGTATLAANVISDNTTALTYLMKIAATEQGYMYIKGDGTLVFTNKQVPAFSPSVFTFADDGTGTKYSALTIQYGQELLYNKITCQTETGLPQTVNDATSQSDYGISTLVQSDLLFSTDAAALSLANYLLNLYKQPAYRFDSVQVDFAGNGVSLANQNSIVALDMSSEITVTKTYQSGTPLSVSQVLTIEGIKHSISPISHSIQFALANANILYPWKLDNATYGKLDGSNALS